MESLMRMSPGRIVTMSIWSRWGGIVVEYRRIMIV